MSVRPVTPDDVEVVVGLVRELADYEKSLDEARMTPAQLREALRARVIGWLQAGEARRRAAHAF